MNRSMKKIFKIMASALLLASVTSCDWFELDNQEGYNASVQGMIKDATTGNPVWGEIYGTAINQWWGSYEVQNTGYITVKEQGWDSESAQNWNVKNNGTYVNKLVFAGTYKMDTKDSNYYPTVQEFELKKGENVVDFTVYPYLRIKDEKISYDAASKKIVATFKVEKGQAPQGQAPVNYVADIRLCCNIDRWVGTNFNNCKKDPGSVVGSASKCTELADGSTLITLTIDTTAECNIEEFKYQRPHYVRIAACGGPAAEAVNPWTGQVQYGMTVNTNNRYNFSPVYKISDDFSKIELVTEW